MATHPAAKHPAAIPLKQLVSAVGEAVGAALDRHKVKPLAKIAIGDGLICGPLLDKAVGHAIPHEIAAEVSRKAQAPVTAPKAQAAVTARQPLAPAVFFGPHHIICGVIIDPQEGIIVE